MTWRAAPTVIATITAGSTQPSAPQRAESTTPIISTVKLKSTSWPSRLFTVPPKIPAHHSRRISHTRRAPSIPYPAVARLDAAAPPPHAGRMTTEKTSRIETQAIHAGEPRPRILGAVTMPIFQSSTFEHGGEGGYHDVRYIRLNNTPNHDAVEAKLAALEGGEAALVTGSGMAAISTTLLTLLRPGDHLLVQRGPYGGTHGLITGELRDLGIEADFFDASAPALLAAAVRLRTRAVYVETMTNPLLDVGDLPAVAAFCKERDLVSIIDNTFASPFNFRPVEHGFDVVVHSCTKYLNGHSDLVAGAVLGRRAIVDAVTHRLNHLGGCLNPETCARCSTAGDEDPGAPAWPRRTRGRCASPVRSPRTPRCGACSTPGSNRTPGTRGRRRSSAASAA